MGGMGITSPYPFGFDSPRDCGSTALGAVVPLPRAVVPQEAENSAKVANEEDFCATAKGEGLGMETKQNTTGKGHFMIKKHTNTRAILK